MTRNQNPTRSLPDDPREAALAVVADSLAHAAAHLRKSWRLGGA